MRTAIALVGAALLCAVPAAAQQQRLAERLDARTATEVSALVDSARALSLPPYPLVQKALEGASKGADAESIVAAVRGLLADLAAARQVLADDPSAITLQLAAAALQAGAPPAALERLSVFRARRSFDGALAGLVYLLSRGVSSDASVGILAGMLEADLSPAEFVSLQRLVEQDLRSGVPSTDAARLRSRALIQGGVRRVRGGTGL